MSRQYREIITDAEVKLCLAACDCEGFDIVETTGKEPPFWQKLGACKCGKRRGRAKPGGGWSVVVDDSVYAPLSVSGRAE